MRSARASYRDDQTYDNDNRVADAGVTADSRHQNHHRHHPPQQQAPQHLYYDPSHYHYMPPPQQPQQQQQQQPLVDHHIRHTPRHHQPLQHPQHHQPVNHHHGTVHHPNHPHPHHHQQARDPAWSPTAAANHDVYHLHIDANDYLMHHPNVTTTAPLDDIMLPPPPLTHPIVTAPITDTNATSVVPGISTRRSPKAKKRPTNRGSTTTAAGRKYTRNRGDAMKASGHGGAGDATYVLRIHEMLEDAEKERQTHIVSWQPHGRAFRIHNEELFVEHIMPRYFKAKLVSFRRWLRAWGFCRMTEGKDRGAWYHRYFVRGVTSFCKGMSRQQMAHSMVQWPPAGQVPNFYSAASERILSEQEAPPALDQPGPSNAAHTVAGESNPNQAPSWAKNPRRLRGTILEDLRQMLDDAEKQGHTHILGWMPHGRAFKIHDRDLFQGLMSRYFRTGKVTHFSDTLRLWGFRRLKKNGKDKGCYYHKLFVRGDPSQSRHLPREKMKASMNDWPPQGGEPDLYRIVVAPPATTYAMGVTPPSTTKGLNASNESATYAMEGAVAAASPTNQDPTFSDQPSVHGCPPQQDGDSLIANKEEASGTNRGDGTYVLRLYEMLEDAEKEGNQYIVSWQPHGRAFRIHKEDEFVQKIMPRYFKAHMKSFLRWCRAWGFVRMTEGRDRGAWYHRYFVRGVMSHSRSMSRQQMFKAMQDWLPPGYIPNFYESGSGSILSETNEQPVKAAPNVTCKNVKRLRGTVPEDLRLMLEEAEEEGSAQIVSWLSHGRAFEVYDKVAFTDHILPRYFKASKYTYFSDALRMWGWQRIKHGRDKGAYYHKLFVRGQPQLTRHLTRIQMKNSMNPWPPAMGEPNLYATVQENTQSQQNQESRGTDTSTALADVPTLHATEVLRPVENPVNSGDVDSNGPCVEETEWI